jgi:transposase
MVRLREPEWERIRDHFPEENIPDSQPGRKPIPTRQVLEAVLWILNTGAQWHMQPQCYPNYKTVHRRFQAWCRSEVLREILMDIANANVERSTKKNALSMRPSRWLRAAGSKWRRPSAEKA